MHTRTITNGRLQLIATAWILVIASHGVCHCQENSLNNSSVKPVDADLALPPTTVRPVLRIQKNDLTPDPAIVMRGQSPDSEPLNQAAPIPLRPPTSDIDSKRSDATTAGGMTRTVAALGVVLGLFLLVALFSKRAKPSPSGQLPAEVFQVLGSTQMPGQRRIQLVQFGSKLLLLGVDESNRTELIAETDDPSEVDRLVQLCRDDQNRSSIQSFVQPSVS